MKRTSITIRLGANVNTVTVDGRTFDRNAMTEPESNKLRRMLVDAKREGHI